MYKLAPVIIQDKTQNRVMLVEDLYHVILNKRIDESVADMEFVLSERLESSYCISILFIENEISNVTVYGDINKQYTFGSIKLDEHGHEIVESIKALFEFMNQINDRYGIDVINEERYELKEREIFNDSSIRNISWDRILNNVVKLLSYINTIRLNFSGKNIDLLRMEYQITE